MSPEGPQPAFSVVIPTLGRPGQLQGCLRALENLDYPRDDYEVVVVNDGGGEPTERVSAAAGQDLDVTLVSTQQRGAAAARNAGVAQARGTFIAFTDDDCRPEPQWLAALLEVLESEPGAAVGGEMVNGAGGRCAAASQAILDATHGHFNRDPDRPAFFATSNLAFRAADFEEFGGFDESFRRAEDRELCERWVHSGRRFAHAPRAVVRHMREMSAAGFLRQHFAYGRGAWDYHRLRRERGWGELEIEPGFYGELARQVRAPRDGAGKFTLAGLAIAGQAANAAGFAWESLAHRLASRTGPSR